MIDEEILYSLSVLHQKLPNVKYTLYKPSPKFSSDDVWSLQNEASSILRHLGMSRYTAVVTYGMEMPGRAGHIELDNKPEFFITISKDFAKKKEKVLAILAHEICHKYLFLHNIYWGHLDQSRNERFTDFATVFTGLGQLSLNGCKDSEGILGYLDYYTFAKAYVIMGGVNGLDNQTMCNGLSNEARHYVNKIRFCKMTESEYKKKMYDKQGHYAEVLNLLYRAESMLHDYVGEIQKKLAAADEHRGLNADGTFNNVFESHIACLEDQNQINSSAANNIIKVLLKEMPKHYVNTMRIRTICPYCLKKGDFSLYRCVSSVKCPYCHKEYIWDDRDINIKVPVEKIDANETQVSSKDKSSNNDITTSIKNRIKTFFHSIGRANKP